MEKFQKCEKDTKHGKVQKHGNYLQAWKSFSSIENFYKYVNMP